MSLAACMRRCPLTTRSPWCAYRLLPLGVSSTDRRASFALEKQRVVLVGEEQVHKAARSYAADADNLHRTVYQAIAVHQHLPIGL